MYNVRGLEGFGGGGGCRLGKVCWRYTRGVRGMSEVVRGVRKTCALFRVVVCFI